MASFHNNNENMQKKWGDVANETNETNQNIEKEPELNNFQKEREDYNLQYFIRTWKNGLREKMSKYVAKKTCLLNETDMANIPSIEYMPKVNKENPDEEIKPITLYHTADILAYAEDKYEDFYEVLKKRHDEATRLEREAAEIAYQKKVDEQLKRDQEKVDRKSDITHILSTKNFSQKDKFVISSNSDIKEYVETGNYYDDNGELKTVASLPLDELEKYLLFIVQNHSLISVRRKELSNKLNERKLAPRPDSKMCLAYINKGENAIRRMTNNPTYTVDDLVDTCVEMDFLYNYTCYQQFVDEDIYDFKHKNKRYGKYTPAEIDIEFKLIAENCKEPAIRHYFRKGYNIAKIPPHLITKYRLGDSESNI